MFFKKNEGGPFGDIKKFSKKSLTVPKKSKGKDGFVCYAEKGTTIIVQFPRPNGTIWPFKILYNFGETFLVSSCELKKVIIIVTFHFMKPRLKKQIREEKNVNAFFHNFKETPSYLPPRLRVPL